MDCKSSCVVSSLAIGYRRLLPGASRTWSTEFGQFGMFVRLPHPVFVIVIYYLIDVDLGEFGLWMWIWLHLSLLSDCGFGLWLWICMFC